MNNTFCYSELFIFSAQSTSTSVLPKSIHNVSNDWPNSYVSQTEICNIQNKIWSIMKLFCIQEHSNFMESQSRKNNFYMPLPHPLERFFGNNFQLFIDICICILACRVCPPYNIFLIAGMSRILVITNSCCPIFISER